MGFLIFRGNTLIITETDNYALTEMGSPNFFFVFFNNMAVCLFLMAGSGIITIPLIMYQGFQLGVMFGIWLCLGYGIDDYLLLTVPHCIFEIPALIVASAVGLSGGSLLLRYYKGEKIEFGSLIKKNLRWIISVPVLLFIAAIIESAFTGLFFNSTI